MSTTFEALEAEVLKLAPGQRLHLFERLVASMDTDAEIEAAWEREADRRAAGPLASRRPRAHLPNLHGTGASPGSRARNSQTRSNQKHGAAPSSCM